MDECCCPPHEAEGPRCPGSASAGIPVDLTTVKALLTETALRRLQPVAHRFCADPGCPVVYYDSEGRVFTGADLRVAVWQKQAPGDRMLCYCFGESEGAIEQEIAREGRSAAEQRIREHIAAGRCACEVRNPRGACCLGDVIEAVKRLEDGRRAPGRATAPVRLQREEGKR
jgi:hypothetical protein